MKHLYKSYLTVLIYFLFLLICPIEKAWAQQCDASTPSFQFDLTGRPDSIWVSPNESRSGICCGLNPKDSPPPRCVEFIFKLDDGAVGINFKIASGAIPSGALEYQIDCGPRYKVGDPICLDGPGPHRLTFCKPGNNPNTYTIESIAAPKVSDAIYVSDGCTGTITTSGYNPSTITWTSVPFNATYNSYLNCTAGCPNVVVTAKPGYPPYVDYQVSGFPLGGCSGRVNQIVRAYFISDKKVTILPKDPVICFGGTTAMVTANGSGGAPPYTYRWSTGATTQSINVAVGTYWVEIKDITSCPVAYDTVRVTAQPSPIRANAGPDLTACENNPTVNLNGTVTIATGGTWSGGTGTFLPDRNTLNAYYTPSAAEVTNGSVTLTLTTTGNGICPPVQDQMVIRIVPSPIVNAGGNKSVCANNPVVTLVGTVTNATGGAWSGGSGTFSNANNLTTNYTPSASEITSGLALLFFTSTGNGSCLPVSDFVRLTITPAPTANAGPNQTVCANNSVVTLAGTVTVATGGTWTGGTGTFAPNRNTLNATYTPSAAEITAGSVSLTLTSTGNGTCLPVSSQTSITITPAPTINAGPDQIVCSSNVTATLAGSVTVATGGNWTGGTGIFSPNRTTLNATYTPSAAEITAGTVTLTLTSTGNGTCNAVSDAIQITITPGPIVNAGPDQTVCGNNASLTLAGSVAVATGGSWTGGTGTFSPNRTTLNATYTPSATEITNGSVTFTLTSTGNGTCLPVSDQMIVTITPAPTVNAGLDRAVCAASPAVALSGAGTNVSTYNWTGGTGTFSPNRSTPTATYTPSATEITTGSVTLTLTASRPTCNPVTDQMVINISPTPVVNAGPDQIVCANNNLVSLSGTVTAATGGSWTGGTGTFSPNRTTLNATYTPSAAEITAGTVALTLTSTGNGICNAVSDEIRITVTPAPTVNAGPDQTVCGNNVNVTLAGIVTVATGGSWIGGTGTFSPNRTTLNATYTPSTSEITAGTVTLTLSTTGNGTCLPASDQMILTITPAPTVNAGPDQTVCGNNVNVTLAGSVTVATGGSWTGGTGTFSPNRTTLNATYTPSATEITNGSVTFTLTSTGNGTCLPVSDQMIVTITPAPTVNAGLDRAVCAASPAVALSGAGTNVSTYNWTGGTGTFSPNRSTPTATYTPSATEITTGSVTLTLTASRSTCNPVTDQMVINISPTPVVNAGPDQIVCANNNLVSLSGTVTAATGGSWTGGTGTFSPNRTTLNATYTPSATEITNGTVTLTLTSTGNGICNAVSDEIRITVTPAPTVNAGPDQTVCGNNVNVTLAGIVTVATGGSWIGGTGTFSPNRTTLNATYTPSTSEITAGTVTLTLSTTGNGTCLPLSDQMSLTITPAPTVNAGPDQTVCGNNVNVTLAGVVTVATGGNWTGGTGTFSPNRTTLNATYTPSTSEITAGTVTLTLSTTGNGTCLPLSDQMSLTITPAPTVNAGPDQTVCGNNVNVTLAGVVTVATGGNWTGGTGTFSPNRTTLNATYTPSESEITAGTVTLTLTSTGNGTCLPVNDEMRVIITPAPTVHAGLDQTVCANNAMIALNGNVTVATGGIWSTSGSGVWSDAQSLTSFYTPSAADTTAGSVILTLTSTGNGTCITVVDQMILTIQPAPVVDAGIDRIVCASNAAVTLNGRLYHATAGNWIGGSGTFVPNRNALNAVYTPTQGEINAGSVSLTLVASRNTCNAVSDEMTITITPPPTINAGPPQSVCANNALVMLNGTITGATGGVWSNGSGTFSPNANALNATYLPSPEERAAGTVTLTLTTTGNGGCLALTSQVIITITPAPTANAGLDQTVCGNNAVVKLNGSVTIASGGIWSGGMGTFAPNRNTLNASYTPSAAEITAGTVTLTLTTTGNGTCLSVWDEMNITITPAPTANAGADQIVCADNAAITLAGAVTIAGGGIWTAAGTGTFSPDATTVNAIYTPSAAEITAGTVTLTLITTGNGDCKPVTDQMVLTITPKPIINAGSDQTICGANNSVPLNGVVTTATGGQWMSSGTGTFSPDANSLTAEYIPSEDDKTGGSVTLTLTSTGNGGCSPVTDDVIISFTVAPSIDAGPNQLIICTSELPIRLTGTGSPAVWSGGNGIFLPDANTLNATYMPTNDEILDGKVMLTLTTTANGICNSVSDQIEIIFLPGPVINTSGSNQTVCADVSTVSLTASVIVAGGGSWLTLWSTSGTGTFLDANDPNTTYTLSDAEKQAGSVTLTLSSMDNGNCLAVSDRAIIYITPVPVTEAGENQSICANNPTAQLNGKVTIGTTAKPGRWVGGLGTFTPNRDALNATYTPHADEITAGTVVLTLESMDNGTCNQVIDTHTITITPAPIVSAGNNQTLCANESSVALSGTVTIGGITKAGLWSSDGTGSFADRTSLVTQYFFSAADKARPGGITLTLVSDENANCLAVSSSTVINFSPIPLADAGPDQSVCVDVTLVSLTGQVSQASGGTWTTAGTGSFASPGDLNTDYTPSADDKSAGFVTLRLATTGQNTGCLPVSDEVTIYFTPGPQANAGADLTLCYTDQVIPLSGSVNTLTGGVWTTTGTGTITDPNSLNTFYQITDADRLAGQITISLRTTLAGCQDVTDQVVYTISPQITSNAGNDRTVCADVNTLQLSGIVTSATGGIWTSTGTGTISLDTDLNATYTLSDEDKSTGTVGFTLTTTGNGNGCTAVTDRMTLMITPAPTVNAGIDQTVCANNAVVNLSGQSTVATAWLWTTSGTGTFSQATSLNTTYTPSALDTTNHSVILTLSTTASGTCNQVSDALTLTITPAPVVLAGANQTVCADVVSVPLQGVVAHGTGRWTTSGSGSFFPSAADLNAQYFPSASDRTGSVTLTLSSEDNGSCLAVSSTMQINFTPVPRVNAGVDQSVCMDATQVTLTGTVLQATGGTWSGPNGVSGLTDPNSMNTQYTFTPADKTAGQVTFTLTSTGNGTGCSPMADQVTVFFYPTPIVDAGPDLTLCYTESSFPLQGKLTGTTSAIWSTTGTGTFSNATDPQAIYQITAADKAAGSLTFNLLASLAGCNDVLDAVTITIAPEIIVTSGAAQTICADVNSLTLNGSLSGVSQGIWTTSGTGTFLNSSAPNTSYTFSAQDKLNGSVTLTLSSVDHGNCNAVQSSTIITITPAPTVFAGVDQTVCANNAVINLSGQSTVATAWLWTTSGTGTFSQETSLNTTYTPSAQDTTNRSVILTLRTTASGTCNQVSDALTLTITPAPVVLAGANQTVCADIASVPLQGVVAHAGGGLWTSSGSGSFFPSATALNAQYFPSASDRTGSVTLTLRSEGNGNCLAVSSTVQINFTPVPRVNAGVDQSVCMDATQVTLTGTVLQATGGTWSGPNGVSGLTDPNSMNTQYTFTPADKTAGQVTFTLTSTGNGTGCSPMADQVTVFFYPTPIVDAGPDLTLCYTESSFPLQGKLTGTTSAIWSTTGTGTFSNATDPQAIYQITAADKAAGSLTFNLLASLAGCNDVLDAVTITIAPEIIVTSGAAQTICADVNSLTLNGSLSGVSQGIWTTSGTGTFLNSSAPNTSYTFSAQDKLNGSVTLTLSSVDHGNCNAVQSSTIITITPAPTVFAGVDQTVCANNAVINLSGQSTVATAWLWTTSGTGTFSQETSLNTTYTPSAQDTTNRSVILTLRTTASGTCNQVSDALTLTITPAPVVLAGADLTVCADVASVPLQGVVAHGTGRWTTPGSGSFFPSADQADAAYFPSDADRAAGLVTLTLTSNGIGNCMAVSQSKRIIINPIPTVDAGPATICADATGIPLNGTLNVATAAVWSAPAGSTGTFTPNATALNAVYLPTASEIAAGTVTLTLTSTAGNGACNPATDQIAVIITPTPTVNAGADQVVCADVAGVALNGQITIASGAIWTSSGNGSFTPNATTLNATYQPSAIDLIAGRATLTLTTTGNGTCNPVIDRMEITITPAPTINAGPDRSICADNNSAVNLAGSVTVATRVVWTSSGSGSFPGGANNLNSSYLPSVADKQLGKVTLTLTSTDQGTCNAVLDRMDLFITPTPIVNAGTNMRICGDETAVLMALSGTLTHATNGRWTTSGTGTFNNPNALNTLYTITQADRLNGTVTFTLTTDDNGRCNPISHTITLTINPPPVVSVSAHQNVCANTPSVTISGSVTHASGGLWTTNGTGTFQPNATALVTTYVPSAADRRNGNVWLTLYSTGNDLCVASRDSLRIIFRPLPVLNGADKIVCVGGSTQISTAQIPGATYQWSHNGINTGTNSNTLQVTVTKEETYLVRVTDVTSCVTSDTIVVRTIPPPVVILSNVPACIGDLVTLDATPVNVTNAPATYTWSKDGVKIPQITASIQVSTPGRYSVIYAAGECTTSATSDVSFNPPPVTQMDSLIKFCKEFDEKTTLDAGPGARYLWLATGNTERKEEVYNPGRYFVRVYNEFNCFTLDTIDVMDICPPRLFVPSAFRPNSNGEDDTFDVFGAYFKDFEMTIFNRWGEIIFHTRDRNESWDGSYRGEPMPIGVYAWTISYRAEFKDYDEGMQRMKGSVTVLR